MGQTPMSIPPDVIPSVSAPGMTGVAEWLLVPAKIHSLDSAGLHTALGQYLAAGASPVPTRRLQALASATRRRGDRPLISSETLSRSSRSSSRVEHDDHKLDRAVDPAVDRTVDRAVDRAVDLSSL
eukprot:Skav223052  [mRNA]  locus=scaffold1069:326952:327329:+ [translate_table: standard]